jgi:Holliday junction resolvasome RuvABC DNA-binding subunit
VMENLTLPLLSEVNLYNFFAGVKGIGRVLTKNILDAFSSEGLIDALVNDPQKLTQVKNIKQKKLNHIIEHWESERKTVFSKARQ